MADRTVHAENDRCEVVRYEKAGKWYVEPKGNEKRRPVGIHDAALVAIALWHDGGNVHFGRPGGSMFDRIIRARYTRASGERGSDA